MAEDSNDGPVTVERRNSIQRADEELLAALGYKQEFKRAFSPLEVRRYGLKVMPRMTVSLFFL